MSRTGGAVTAKGISPNELYSQSAIYIAAAHALKPNYSVCHLYLKYMIPFYLHCISVCIKNGCDDKGKEFSGDIE